MDYSNIENLLNFKPYNNRGDTLIDYSCVGSEVPYTSTADFSNTYFVTQCNCATLQSILDNTMYDRILFDDDLFLLSQPLQIRRSNIVVEGKKDTKLVFDNCDVGVNIKGDKWCSKKFPIVDVFDDYVPVGSKEIRVCKSSNKFAIGDTIRIVRKGNAEWISHIGMDKIPPRPDGLPVTQWDEMILEYDRVVVDVKEGNLCVVIVLNAAIPCAVERKWGGGYVFRYVDSRISKVFLSNLVIECKKNTAIGILIDNAANVAIQSTKTLNCDRFHTIGRGCKNVTVEKCVYDKPSSTLVGGNRHAFHIQGQLILIKDCLAIHPRHAFSIDARVPGPNVIYNSSSENDHDASEPHHRWSVGTLFDNVKSKIYIQNREWMGSGHGWAGANYMVWNCEGEICCQNPPTADNFVVGHMGKRFLGSFSNNPQGHFINFGTKVSPVSLFETQITNKN